MKKIFLLFVTLCLAHLCFAQVKVNSAGNTGIGIDPKSNVKLSLSNSSNSSTIADGIFGLHSTVNNQIPGLPSYGIYSENTNGTLSSAPGRIYGAYLKNSQMSPANVSSGIYGIYLDNISRSYASTSYGVYTNNSGGGYSTNMYGYYVKNPGGGYSGSLYGLYADNTSTHTDGRSYGVYLNNNKPSGTWGMVYGIYSTNTIDVSNSGQVYGAYLSASSPRNGVYGIYSTVSCGSTNTDHCFAGYFTGGEVVVMNGNVGIGREQPAYLLDVNGTIRVSSTLYSSDERLKSDIKPLTDEKDKLYLLQGKSYKKALIPVDIKDSLTLATAKKTKEKTIETPEYGYLAQELKEVFPDLVSQDSAGYYSVNYIGLIPVIVEALKDQRSENEKKQIQIEKQQIQIDEQREQIKQLVKLMGIKSIDKKVFEENGIESIPLLLQNTPNPFNQSTEIGYFIPETVGSANIYIYDVNGVQQRNISIAERGNGITVLQATALQAGIYFYTLICDGKPVDTKQMILTK